MLSSTGQVKASLTLDCAPAHYYGLPPSECKGLGTGLGLGDGGRDGALDGALDGTRDGTLDPEWEAYGDPYGASWYLGVSNVSRKYPPSPFTPPGPSMLVVPLRPSALAIARGLPNGDDFFRENACPRIGASELAGVAFSLVKMMGSGSYPAGWLYIQVAARTVEAPITKDGVILKSKSATEAREERTIDRLVAKPFRMLSEYLITMAVTNPPKTWTATVAQAHPPKFRNRSRKKPRESEGAEAKRMGRSAGMRENNDSCTLRTQRSALEFFNTISKYTPARPEVKQAAVTAPKPLRGFMMCM